MSDARKPSPWATPLSFHRMAHSEPGKAQWWRPFAVLGIVIGLTVVAYLALIVLALAIHAVAPQIQPSEGLTDATNPVDMLANLGSVAILLPIALLAMRWGGGRRGTLHSVAGRFRWRFLLKPAPYIAAFYALFILGPALLFGRDELTNPGFTPRIVSVFIIILLLTPFQCAAEEYVFRALPQQGLGTWLKHPAWGIIVPVPFFMAGHGYDWVGQIDIATFALCAGLLAWKSGGVELPTLMHVSNNLFSFLIAPFAPNSLEQGEVSPATLIFSLPMLLVTTAALWWYSNRAGHVGWREPIRRPAANGAALAALEATAQRQAAEASCAPAFGPGRMAMPPLPYPGLGLVADRGSLYCGLRQQQLHEAVVASTGENPSYSVEFAKHTITFSGEHGQISAQADVVATVAASAQSLQWQEASSVVRSIHDLARRFGLPQLAQAQVPFAHITTPDDEARLLAQLASFAAMEAVRDEGCPYVVSSPDGTQVVLWLKGIRVPELTLATAREHLLDLSHHLPIIDRSSALLGVAEHAHWHLQWVPGAQPVALLGTADHERLVVVFNHVGQIAAVHGQ